MSKNQTNEKNGFYRFGEGFPNKGWIECDSKTYPNKVFYYNVYSGCSSWIRPLPEDIQLPKHRPKTILQNLHSPGLSELDISSIDNDGDSTDCKIINHLFGTTDTRKRKISLSDDIGDDVESVDSYECASINSQRSVASVEMDLLIPETVYYYPEKNSWDVKQLNKMLNDDSSSCSIEEIYYCDRPHLKSIGLLDLVVGKQQRKRRRKTVPKRKAVESDSSEERASFDDGKGRVYEMYGTKTVNYDIDFEAEQKKAIKQEKLLSASSSSSSSSCGSSCSCTSNCSENTQNSTAKPDKKKIDNYVAKVKNPKLSDSESS